MTHMIRKRIAFGLLLLFVSLTNPGCKHEKPDARTLYLKYLKNHLRK